eukprot:jgi/Ulvmu1/12194/UM085_0058.1
MTVISRALHRHSQGRIVSPRRPEQPSQMRRTTSCCANIDDKVVLITGASDGIGQFTATQLAVKGAKVIIHGRDAGRVANTAAAMQQEGNAPAAAYTADLRSLHGMKQLANKILNDFDEIDILVNNAGVYMDDYMETEDGFEQTWAVNVLAPYVLTASLASAVRERVINVSSISAASCIDWDNLQQENGFSSHNAYGLSKLALQMLTVKMAQLFQSRNVTVACLDPGTVNTKMLLAGWGRIGIQVNQAKDLTWICSSDDLKAGAFYVSRRHTNLRQPAQDKGAVQKMWEIVEAQTGIRL